MKLATKMVLRHQKRRYVCLSVCLSVCLDGWMDGWMDVWMYVCMYVSKGPKRKIKNRILRNDFGRVTPPQIQFLKVGVGVIIK